MKTVTYGSQGAEFTVAKSGDNPLIQSNFYIMFGRVELVIKAAPGVGIVSSAVLQSDCLDEIDWEWLGGDNAEVQTNYFGKGRAAGYNRSRFHPDPENQDTFKTYTVDWNEERIIWQIDGATIRSVTVAESNRQYPQTPAFIRIGVWAGGDPTNDPGTIGKPQSPVK
jgi:beta-glucanase (GH16 family)